MPRDARPRRHLTIPTRVSVVTAVVVALLAGLIGAGAATAAARAYITSSPVTVQAGEFNPRGSIGAPQLMAGGCAIRFSGSTYRPVKHYNDAHICANITTLRITSSGQLEANFARRAAVVSITVDEDETLTERGIMAGASGGVAKANISFYDTKAKRRLNLTKRADRARIGGKTANIWLSFLQVGPAQ
ncbi:hypothetical protein [Kribbia dieselivorans]|uniref:hypothetical protein n=1 Tax=Kribbia dieselivorans TaxID=331526 RepID=UPI000839AEE5|nr:hypothetical protein [Kribbia dieselivorans]